MSILKEGGREGGREGEEEERCARVRDKSFENILILQGLARWGGKKDEGGKEGGREGGKGGTWLNLP